MNSVQLECVKCSKVHPCYVFSGFQSSKGYCIGCCGVCTWYELKSNGVLRFTNMHKEVHIREILKGLEEGEIAIYMFGKNEVVRRLAAKEIKRRSKLETK